MRLGEMIAQDMVAIRLTPPFRAILVASPDYLSRSDVPRTVADLQRLNCIGYRQLSTGGTYAWELRDDGRDVALSVAGTARVTDPLFALELALAGVGVAYLFEPLVRRPISEGRLRWILPEAAIEEPGLFLYYPRRAGAAPKLRAMVDAARRLAASGAVED